MLTESLSSSAWPSLTVQPPTVTGENNSSWEMIAEEDEPSVGDRVVILPSDDTSRTCPSVETSVRRRERSATICGLQVSATKEQSNESVSSGSALRSPRRHLRRCASTPDLLVSDNAHEIIVEDESDSSSEEEGEAEAVNVLALEEESFEVVTEGETEIGEQVMIDSDEESGTFVSAPSEGTSSWTMATTPSAGAWGDSNMTKKTPSFADMLKINMSSGVGEWGTNKEETEARLKNVQNKHRIRVRTKPKIVVTEMKHALSTGDLTKMAEMEEERERDLGRNRRPRRQLSAMMEEEEADLMIGRGSGDGGGTTGGDCGYVLGDTDAMDFYHRKEAGSKSTHNKKKERPDEAKRKEISMHKKDMQRKKQAEKGGSKGGGGAKKKKTQQFGGKKERRRL
ncbi:hypothetical protein THAOC_35298 [Thalassiosira oceanica]|uniref:Uncharacterized protein n=1 Tax=Thalassiosira oceanica TaxID=159749 RepID=K0RAH7_THAOC|nr:hypothetical protein THAOC_35298 [Thalassiosira oceanica]|mmetsp:Transcript_7091/g.14986  ORF Transcript_7091/g.14986 Transcript_7091/m.14986 type:complete len:397 (-) Transcript_7091:949-2139(-)|eukprot:EJK46056.1 hypothetical protein THAOC_35298 [Thalassiosira oceanica]